MPCQENTRRTPEDALAFLKKENDLTVSDSWVWPVTQPWVQGQSQPTQVGGAKLKKKKFWGAKIKKINKIWGKILGLPSSLVAPPLRGSPVPRRGLVVARAGSPGDPAWVSILFIYFFKFLI
jgi:hypothetical protein